MDKILTVVGTGVSYATPDAVVINGQIIGTVADYSEAVRSSAEALTAIRKSIGEAGFDMDDLKTTSFSVDTVYKNGASDTVEFSGYRYMHGISITTDADGETLGRLLQALTSCSQAPEFRVSYVVRDPSEPMKEARQAAVKDAKHKARELAAAIDVKLGDVVSVNYGSNGYSPSPRAMMVSAMAVDAVPRDAEFYESVTVQWEIV